MRKLNSRLGLFAGAFALALSPFAVGQNILAIQTASANLVEIDPTGAAPVLTNTVALTLAGQTINGGNGLTRNPLDDTLYALLRLQGTNSRELVTVDEMTGVCTSIGSTGAKFSGITFAADGTLYGVTGTGASQLPAAALYTLSLVDGSATMFLTSAQLGGGGGGEAIGFNTADGKLYHTTGATFVSIDISIPAVDATIPQSGGAFLGEFLGLVYNDANTFYALSPINGFSDAGLFTITDTGVVTPIGLGIGVLPGGGFVRGMALALPGPPANDDCVNAAVAVPGLTAFDNTLATTDGVALDPGVCDMGTFGDDQIYRDLWYCFTAPTTDAFEVTTFGLAGIDTRLAVYDNGCGSDDPATVIACNDDVGGFPFEAGLTFSATAGTSYKIRLGSYGASNGAIVATPGAGEFLIQTIILPTPPANDNCENATVLNAFGTYDFDNTLATTDGADMTGFCDLATFGTELVHKDVWFEYTPAVGGCTYISTLGLGGFDSSMAVYDSSSCPDDPATIIACSSEEVQSPLVFPWEAGLDVDLVAGQTYLIRIGSYGNNNGFVNAGGAGQFQIAAGPIAVNNDGGLQIGAPGCAVAPVIPASCFGDGLGRPCKCGNDDALNPGTGGCLNSNGTGAILTTNGDTSVLSNDLQFNMTGGVPTALAVLTSGDNALGGGIGILGLPESDGLRCVGVNFRRHGSRGLDSAGATVNAFGSVAGPAGGIVGQAGFVMGQTRHFQVRYREDPMIGPCGFGTNTSQALSITFQP